MKTGRWRCNTPWASIPTLLVFRNGQLVNRSVGLISREDVLKLVQA